MSYFDDASLVMIPSGYKTSKVYSVKPTDGTGDLTFTRSNDTASRVNSAGLIEKVRTNLLTHSNDFSNAAWLRTNVIAPTANAIANPLTGAIDAWKLVEDATNNFHFIYIFPTFASGEVSFSFYAKSAERTTCSAFLSQGGNTGGSFNLSTGVATASGTGNTASMVSVGGGWYRCIVTNNGSAAVSNQVRIGVADGALSDYAGDGTSGIYIYAAQAEQGVATDYIATTSAAVSVGPVANVPRLDYLDSSCPRLLLEPQRTNLVTYSEQFDNAAWTKSNATVTANTSVSPDGYTNADTVVITAGGYLYRQISGYSAVSGQSVAYSVFAKNQTSNFLIFGGATPAGTDVYKIENYGNGWYRHSVVRTFTTTTTGTLQYLIGFEIVGTHIVWGAQIETLVSYATSYIPTLGAAVTRGADACSKTGISSLIGGTSGTIFFEIKTNKTLTSTNFKQFFYYTDASAAQAYIYLNGSNYLVTNPSLGNITGSLQFQADTTYKVAIAYASNDFKLYVNGVERGSSTSGTPINALNLLSLGSYAGSAEFNEFVFSQYIHFPTRLSNSDLAALTA